MREEESLVAVFFRTIAIFLSIVIIIVALLYGGWLYLTKDLTLKEYNPNVSVDIDESNIYESDIKNVKEKIIDWQKNGQPAKDDNVLNILLMGIDVESSDMNKNSRADAMMLVSINHNTKTITLASILRDQYCYIEKRDSFESTCTCCCRYFDSSSYCERIQCEIDFGTCDRRSFDCKRIGKGKCAISSRAISYQCKQIRAS